MPSKCVVCNEYGSKGSNISLHSFPKDKRLKKQWLKILDLDDWEITAYSVVCIKHFKPEDIDLDKFCGLRKLKIGAIPQSQAKKRKLDPRLSQPSSSKSFVEENVRINNDVMNGTDYGLSKEQQLKRTVDFENPYAMGSNSGDINLEKFCGLRRLEISAIPQLRAKEQKLDNRLSQPSSSKAFVEENVRIDSNVIDGTDYGFSKEQQLKSTVDLDHTYTVGSNSDVCSKCGTLVKKDNKSTQTEDKEEYQEPSQTPPHSIMEQESIPSNTGRYKSPRYIGDLTEKHFSTPRRTVRHVRLVKNIFAKQQKKVKDLVDQKRNLTKRISSLTALLEELEQKQLITNERSQMLLDMTPETIKEIVDRKIQYGRKYSAALRSFAITLHFYSPRAYNYVRQNFNKMLPHANTIRKWYQVVDGQPGFTRESFDSIKARNLTSGPVIVNIVIDEMSIRQQVVWDAKRNKWFGFVDIGTGLTSDSEDLPHAKNALVFMAVALNDSWKVPIGYFLIESLSGAERATLLKTCLQLIHETGALTFSLTFDGAPVNFTMCTNLGANFNLQGEFKPFISHPVTKDKVFIFVDGCHILKLIRNAIAERKQLLNEKNETIKWEYLELLVKLQTDETLVAANKLSLRHINFQNEKMNVRLAAQTLSASVSHALNLCEHVLGHSEFVGASATAEFIMVFNNLFDIMNSRNRFSNNKFNMPITDATYEFFKKYAQECEHYIRNLKDESGRFIINSNRKTGFLGFIIGLRNLLELFNVVRNFNMSYLLSYKLSQDHLELFFGSIRSRGGFNNNPSVKHFVSAYKSLLVRHQISASQNGNCAILDATKILHVSSGYHQTCDKVTNECDTEIYNSDTHTDKFDHDYVESLFNLSAFSEDIVKYIAGFVVYKIKKQFVCKKCLPHLCSDVSTSQLENLKTRGYLQIASPDVCKICIVSEKAIRKHKHDLFKKKNIKEFLIVQVMNDIVNDNILCSDDMLSHIKNQEFLNDHRHQLIKLIITFYLDLRFHHEAKRNSQRRENLRSKYTHYILFKNQ